MRHLSLIFGSVSFSMNNKVYNKVMVKNIRTKDDLQSLIDNEAQEDLHLDFKCSDSLAKSDGKKKEISKDVSAFANSDGGTIIYGIVEANHKATELDDGVSGTDITKEWLEQVISSTVTPKIDELEIIPIPRDNGKFNYIVHIPRSERSPHQSFLDKRFYKRYNFQSVPMEQYEIMDIINRRSTPDLTIKLPEKEFRLSYTVEGGNQRSQIVQISPTITNLSNTLVEYCSITLYIDNRIEVKEPREIVLLSKKSHLS